MKRRLDDSHAEMLRRLRLGNLRKLCRHRYGATLPDNDAGRADLRELLLLISVSANAAMKMPKAIELWAPWMGRQEAIQLIDDIGRTPIWQRKPSGKVLGRRLRVTNAQRERLKLWTIAACDMSQEEAQEWRKAKNRERRRWLRQLRGGKPRAEYETTSTTRTKPWLALGMSRASWYRRETSMDAELVKSTRIDPQFGETSADAELRETSMDAVKLIRAEDTLVSPEMRVTPKKTRTVQLAQMGKPYTPTKAQKPKLQRRASVDATAQQRTNLSQEGKMASQDRNLDHGLQVMLDILTGYLGNHATRGEWLTEIQKRFTGRNRKLRRGWSDDSIDRKIIRLEQMGLIAGGRGFGAYWSAVTTAQPGTEQTRPTSLLGFAGDADAPVSASERKLSANESFRDVLNAAKLQLLKGGKSSAA